MKMEFISGKNYWELTYQGITDVCRILSCKNTDYIAANPDLLCPTDFGFVPDCGSICQMLGNIGEFTRGRLTLTALYMRQRN